VEHATSQGAAHLTGQPGFTRNDDNGTITRTLWVPDTPSVGADQARCTRILVLCFASSTGSALSWRAALAIYEDASRYGMGDLDAAAVCRYLRSNLR
jgi:hypothetical protein